MTFDDHVLELVERAQELQQQGRPVAIRVRPQVPVATFRKTQNIVHADLLSRHEQPG